MTNLRRQLLRAVVDNQLLLGGSRLDDALDILEGTAVRAIAQTKLGEHLADHMAASAGKDLANEGERYASTIADLLTGQIVGMSGVAGTNHFTSEVLHLTKLALLRAFGDGAAAAVQRLAIEAKKEN